MADNINDGQVVVVLEGTGGAGKSTQSRNIVQWLRGQGQNVCLLKLPCYSTHSGVMIQEMLRGTIRKWTPEATQLYYATNRAEIADYIANGIDAGYSFVIDRWVSSNALSTFGTLGMGLSEALEMARAHPEEFARLLQPNFEWMRNIDQPFLKLFNGVKVAKIFLDVASGKIAEESRVGRSGEVGNDVFEGGTEGELRMEILRRYIRFDGGWESVVRDTSTGINDIRDRCVGLVQEKMGIGLLGNMETEGSIVDLTEFIATRVYSKEVIERWRQDVTLGEEVRREGELAVETMAGGYVFARGRRR